MMSECLAGHCDGECQYPTVCSRALQPEIDRLRAELAVARLAPGDQQFALNGVLESLEHCEDQISKYEELVIAKDARIAELEGALEHNNSALDGANAIIAKLEIERWKRCPSTHCERRGECASPHECIVKVVAFRPTISGRED